MKLNRFSQLTQDALRRWSMDMFNDELMLDDIFGLPEHWAWVWFLLRESEDRPEWFPHGKSATLQILEGFLITEAQELLGSAKQKTKSPTLRNFNI